MARRADRVAGEAASKPKAMDAGRTCSECGVKLSVYNANPTCWQHTLGHPYRGPHAKPKY